MGLPSKEPGEGIADRKTQSSAHCPDVQSLLGPGEPLTGTRPLQIQGLGEGGVVQGSCTFQLTNVSRWGWGGGGETAPQALELSQLQPSFQLPPGLRVHSAPPLCCLG